ncbi:MAG: hypothetical protein ACXW4M_08350, partial [Anaerolineales bacterium]
MRKRFIRAERMLSKAKQKTKRTRQNSRFVCGAVAPPLSARILLLTILILTSCAPATAEKTGSTPTAVIAGATATQPAADAQPRPTIAPFRFVLPTPGAEP